MIIVRVLHCRTRTSRLNRSKLLTSCLSGRQAFEEYSLLDSRLPARSAYRQAGGDWK
ncbi:MAG: hypothetical protein M1120_03085 [Patescibacteria group bacterium]|nr:hypothetical protein [Patescibacteria group bacterium]